MNEERGKAINNFIYFSFKYYEYDIQFAAYKHRYNFLSSVGEVNFYT